jgi:glucose/arabinose dehydrogenase
MLSIRTVLSWLLLLTPAAATAGTYTTLSTRCDGLPQLPIGTLDGLCVGLVAQAGPTLPLKMPRSLVELDDGSLLVVDMGGWAAGKGRLWRVDYRSQPATATELLSGLNLPHKILFGPMGKIYLGEAHRIRRFAIVDGKIAQLETVIDNLPHSAGYLHPLKNFVFESGGDLLVNVGSTSDRCEKKLNPAECMDGSEAGIWRYRYKAATRSWQPQHEVLARGLRNSMALAVHSSGTILQAENSIDLAEAEEPYEEINVIVAGKFYGWPLCYDRDVGMDGKPCSADNYQPPWTLLPPHVAPLDAIYYNHSKLAPLKNQLLLSWHGYRIVGSRLVAYPIDVQGRPLRQKTAEFWRAPAKPDGAYTRHAFAPRGSLGLVAQHSEVISQWHEIPGLRPEGAPTGISVAGDGSLFIVDDRNRAILRLSNGIAYRARPVTATAAPTVAVKLPTPVRAILLQRCAACHAELIEQPQRLIADDKWLLKDGGVTRMQEKLFNDKIRPMPPDQSLSDADKRVLRDWLRQLH